jgi:hypothetical protein
MKAKKKSGFACSAVHEVEFEAMVLPSIKVQRHTICFCKDLSILPACPLGKERL